ncbi:hypothetical protein F6V30_12175 [Oryzomonas sagensis]|uniref:Uncharacterized protein n=1 Tax=Oryzomonas sagensis TaxID=2603857 RepID=A0ABQ6TM97_9BACT|nr:hypothetical protein [Oryzomonas sagensis]KAB0669555.1 hypothetical protein F6V30_12175 [Oryzomonas sagensis]
MAGRSLKRITITILAQEHARRDWYFDFEAELFRRFCEKLSREMKKLGVALSIVNNRDTTITINSYADLLNCVKISSPDDGHSNQCVGHIIGKSEHLDIMEDIGTAVRRIAFAPETVAPSNEFRKVCHNCGCGC